jgi:hypothetical protein
MSAALAGQQCVQEHGGGELFAKRCQHKECSMGWLLISTDKLAPLLMLAAPVACLTGACCVSAAWRA